MNLLFLAHRIPYPPNKGDKIRSYHELRTLAARHRVHLGCFADQAEDLRYVGELRRLAASVEVVPLDGRVARLRALGALAARTPLSVRYFASRRLARWVRDLVRREPLDAVFLFSSPMAQYADDLDLPRVMDFCDVDSAKWAQYATAATPLLRPVYAIEARRLRAYEESVLRRFDAGVLVTEREKALWNDLPAELQAKVHVVGNGVDLEYFAPAAAASAPGTGSMVFTGAMDYWANVDAVVFFAREVLPRVRAVLPEATFTIVGSRPTAEVLALGSRPGVRVTGFVDDTRPWYSGAALCVVPLRIARGIQNKLLEAMAMGRPVLASSAAAAGLGARSGDEVWVADDAEALAASAVTLLRDPERAALLGQAGRRFVERRYDWKTAMGALETLLEASVADRAAAGRPAPATAPELVTARG